jgi:nicotinate-nucleotide adenylyltransferase
MLRLAIAEDPHLEVSDLEVRRQGTSYTYETLRDLSLSHPDSELFLILGIDAYKEIETWHRPGDLLSLAHIVITSRPGAGSIDPCPPPPVAAQESCCYDSHIGGYEHKTGHRLVVQSLVGVEASSSDVRRRIREGRPFAHLTGRPVADYIHTHRLYGAEDR